MKIEITLYFSGYKKRDEIEESWYRYFKILGLSFKRTQTSRGDFFDIFVELLGFDFILTIKWNQKHK